LCRSSQILNLALWFGLHVLFREVYQVRVGPLTLDVPSLASIDPVALLLFCGAAIALF
jgi:chromate transporter|tara:strand:- start:212 stop:385 length:174 start_codon:yes stop_codon:yes gene_type:complete